MNTLVANSTGLLHLAASVLALITGTCVLVMAKGTRRHKQAGYAYVASMLVLLITAFMIYRLFGTFGIFHALGLVSAFTLVMGMYPVIAKRSQNYVYRHFRFMYWSVMGLYGAFVAETMVRIPFLNLFNSDFRPTGMFFNITGISVGLVMVVAALYFKKKKHTWIKQFTGLEKITRPKDSIPTQIH